ncbi:YjgN family protein [Bacterioplanoides sp.]|uniref:YjgN family protein n=1 Tax=Bacterioplanoides sp. TaxID=2066072 RepID=UPI003B593983
MTEITAESAASKTVPIEFSGQKMEYTKLWLVNMLLTIITFGIYSAWAKVRNTQYLYGHTQVDGHRLRYLATPIQILRGRIIAVALFGTYALLNSLNPLAGVAAILVLLGAMPWLLIQGIKFSLRMTAYRDVRFSFHATYSNALGYFFLLPLAAVLTFGLAMPWALQKVHKYIHENISYGGKRFKLDSRVGHYYMIMFVVAGTIIFAMLAILAVFGVLGVGAKFAAGTGLEGNSEAVDIIVLSMLLGFYFINYLVAAIVQSMIRNHIMNNLKLESVVSFNSDIRIPAFVWLNFSNALLIIFTLGLGYPATKIRKNAFLAAATQANIEPGIESLMNTVSDQDSAIGEEAAGLFDADFSLT